MREDKVSTLPSLQVHDHQLFYPSKDAYPLRKMSGTSTFSLFFSYCALTKMISILQRNFRTQLSGIKSCGSSRRSSCSNLERHLDWCKQYKTEGKCEHDGLREIDIKARTEGMCPECEKVSISLFPFIQRHRQALTMPLDWIMFSYERMPGRRPRGPPSLDSNRIGRARLSMSCEVSLSGFSILCQTSKARCSSSNAITVRI